MHVAGTATGIALAEVVDRITAIATDGPKSLINGVKVRLVGDDDASALGGTGPVIAVPCIISDST